MAARLSVNVNKVATVRNSRGGQVPSVIEAVRVCVAAGSPGITVHPREDERHITRNDVYEIAAELKSLRGRVEYNIEGDPRPDWLALVHEIKPEQATLVPVIPGEITSQAGWTAQNAGAALPGIVRDLQRAGIRVSLFIDATVESVDWAASLRADRVELYTEPYARAFANGPEAARASFDTYVAAAERAHARGVGINAGHDLDLDNLPMFGALPHLDEVSIGHALISRAIFVGLENVVRDYLRVLREVDVTAGGAR
jgi:pyridoxine 5-phosphate synthase